MTALSDPAPVRKGEKCSVGKTLAALPLGDRATLVTWLKDRDNYTGSQISAALKAAQYDVGDYAVNRHRRAGCKCPQ